MWNMAGPDRGAVQRNHTEWPLDGPPCAGSLGSRVALMLLPYADPYCPQTMSGLANASFSGGGVGISRQPRAKVPAFAAP